MDAIVQAAPTTSMVSRLLRENLPFVLAGVAVLVLGLVESWLTHQYTFGPPFILIGPFIAIAFGAALALCRIQPGVALAIVGVGGALQLTGSAQVMFVQVVIVVIAFAIARWGSVPVQWVSGLSIPVAVLLVALTGARPFGAIVDALGFNGIITAAEDLGLPWRILVTLAAVAVLGLPWLTGYVRQAVVRARRSEATTAEAREEVARVTLEAQQAAEIAKLREERSQLALDVHDVVGHSLAVILAQAESAQFLRDDPALLKKTFATIATSARSSLQDVGHVLSGDGPAPRPLDVDALLESARAAGFKVDDDETGEPHPLPPELQTVAHRVLQEMITNAIRHGSRKSPIRVARRWPEQGDSDLVIEVSNATDAPVEVEREGAQGLEGMRRRLEAVSGTLDIKPPARKGGRFATLATIPMRARGRAADA